MVSVLALFAAATTAPADAALTTPSCLAKKLKEWGKLRKCQAVENGKALQGKPADLAKCQTKFDSKLGVINDQATAAAIPCRYRVNGGADAGTVTDYDTGLQWEKKDDAGASIHDKDLTWTWNTVAGGQYPDGTAFVSFLGFLNGANSGCFAGHCDWRLPAVDELVGIVDMSEGSCGGGSGPCIDQTVFGPTVANSYWSASGYSGNWAEAWYVHFFFGGQGHVTKSLHYYVRAVRSAL